MALLLAIETTTRNCSVALFHNNTLLQLKEKTYKEYSHAELLTLFIQEVIENANIRLQALDCIVLSEGPGSYTGLRIGASTAKGLCYALNIPLVSVSTLKIMISGILKKEEYKYYCPMIDARRMEVFSLVTDKDNNEVREIQSDIVDDTTYAEFLSDKVLFFGDGAIKCKKIISSSNAIFLEGVLPSSRHMGILGFEKFGQQDFEDVAYFEPYYFKAFFSEGGKNS